MRAAVLIVAVIAIVCLSARAAGGGRAYCPRVTSEHNADTTDLKRFRQFHAWKDKTGGELAEAVWRYLCDYETGLYHFNVVEDGPDPWTEYSHMREPLKMLNVYNMGYCGIFGPTVAGIYHGIGFETTRSFGLSSWSHRATEIFYDGKWHYFDVDVRGALKKADGTIASLHEAQTDAKLWVESRDRIKPSFPSHDSPEKAAHVADIYARGHVDFDYQWFQGSHTADWTLRPGETFTRYWQPQGGRWHHIPEYNKIDWVRKLILTAPVGAKPNHRDFTPWNHGNGLFQYRPDLSSASKDVQLGARSLRGLAPGKQGLTLTAAEGEAVFNVFTPFIIVAKVNDLDDFSDDREASVVKLEATGPVTVSCSRDNGLTWIEAARVAPGKAEVDLTQHVRGLYGYLLKLSAAGKPNAPAVRSLAIDTWVQVAPISLPRLKQGANHLRYDAGDRYDGVTTPMIVLPNTADPADLARHVVAMPAQYDPAPTSHARIKGECILKLPAPPGRKIVWLSVGGTFQTHQNEGAKNTAHTMGYAVGEPKGFKQVYKANVPTWVNHWRMNHDTDIRLDTPAEVVYVRYVGDPALNTMRACLHLTPPAPQDLAVAITHGYTLDGKMTEKTVKMNAPGDYTVDCPGKVENVFIRMEKPSTR